jgi:hypothetical protein
VSTEQTKGCFAHRPTWVARGKSSTRVTSDPPFPPRRAVLLFQLRSRQWQPHLQLSPLTTIIETRTHFTWKFLVCAVTRHFASAACGFPFVLAPIVISSVSKTQKTKWMAAPAAFKIVTLGSCDDMFGVSCFVTLAKGGSRFVDVIARFW